MKNSRRFWLGILGLFALVVFVPAFVTILMFAVSPWVKPVVFIALLVAVSAVLAYKGGIGR
ncbi:MAG: hypothetical protein ACOYB8_07790 [Eubacteriaceae bacterium]|jgi:hypothetical protein